MASELEVGKVKVSSSDGGYLADIDNTNSTGEGLKVTTAASGAQQILQLNNGSGMVAEVLANGDVTSTNATGSKPILTLENTANDANSSQLLFLKNRTATNNDILGTVRFRGNNNAGTPEVVEYATIYAQSTDVADGAEDGQLIFRTMKDGTLDARLTIASNGVASFSRGIAFSQTNSTATGATATGTTLDHYEEGTWTASLQFGSSDTGITYNANGQQGFYRRIGNMVYVSCIVALTSKGSETGDALIAGLPFIVADNLASTALENSLTSAYSNVGLAHAFASGYKINMRNSSHTTLTDADFANSSSLRIAGWYTTN